MREYLSGSTLGHRGELGKEKACVIGHKTKNEQMSGKFDYKKFQFLRSKNYHEPSPKINGN